MKRSGHVNLSRGVARAGTGAGRRGAASGRVPSALVSSCATYFIMYLSVVKFTRPPDKPFSATKSGIIYDARAVLMRCAYGGDGGTRGSPDGCRKFDWCAEGRLSAGDVWCSGKPRVQRLQSRGLLLHRLPRNALDAAQVDVQGGTEAEKQAKTEG